MKYDEAVELRARAERAQDPESYKLAALAFDILEMSHAAERCRQREAHYRRLLSGEVAAEREIRIGANGKRPVAVVQRN